MFHSIKQTKKKEASTTVKTSATVEISVRSLQHAIYKLSGLCFSTINDSEGRHFPPFFVFYSIVVPRVSRKKKGIVEGRHFSLISHLFYNFLNPVLILILGFPTTIRLRERYIAEIQEAPRKRTIKRERFDLNCYQNCYQLIFLFAFLFIH